MTIRIDQIADAIISAPGSTIKVLDFIPVNDITTSSLTFVEVDNGTDIAGTSFSAPVSGSYVFAVDLDTITSGATDTRVCFRLVIDKGTANEKIVAPDLGYWIQIHTTVSIHRQISFMTPPVVLTSGGHAIVLEWNVSNGSATARMTGTYSYVYINALSSGASGAGGILLDSYSILVGDATYNNTDWTDILIQSGGSSLQISFDAIINESIGVNVSLDAYNYVVGSDSRYAEFRLLLDGVEEIAWARQRFNSSAVYEELVSLMAYVPELVKGPHTVKAQVKVENSDMAIAFMSGDSRGKLELIRFRGGLVPIQKDGTTITATPSALNFNGTSLNITDTFGVVDFTFYEADAYQDGYLNKTDWSTFNNKLSDIMTERGDLIYRNSSNVTDRLPIGADGYVLESDGYDLIWSPSSGGSYTNPDPSVIEVGGIPIGTTFSSTTFSEFMDLLLYPELFPTLVSPSSTFTMTPNGLREVGEVITTLAFSSVFGRGTITPAYGTSGYRSGLPNQYTYTGTRLVNSTSTSLTDSYNMSDYTVILGSQSWTGRVAYDIGEQPLSSEGNNYSTPLSAGNTNIITNSINGVYPYFCSSVSIAVMTKQSLAAHGATVITSMVAESGGDKQSVEFPTAWGTIAHLSQYNTLSGLYDIIDLATFTATDITNVINGNTINYKKYTHNGSLTGSRILKWEI